MEQSEEHDIDKPVISYVFPRHGLELACDLDDTIRTIFLTSDEFVRFNEHFLDLPFSSSRQQVLERLGSPSKSGGPISDPILGEFGLWDRFAWPGYTIHVAFRPDSDRIRQIMLMRPDMVPGASGEEKEKMGAPNGAKRGRTGRG